MKTVEFDFNNKTYYLCMNGAALFDCYDKFGAKGEIIDNILRLDKKGFSNTCWLLAKLSEQGEAVRKYMGLETQKPLTEIQCQLLLKPIEVLQAKEKIVKAIGIGFAQTEEDDEEKEIDIGLAEINQKKTRESRGHNTFIRRCGFFGSLRKK